MTPPPHLSDVLTAAGFTGSEISSIESGKLMSGVVESLTDRELAAKFACTINAPVEDMAETFMTSKREYDPNANHVGSIQDKYECQIGKLGTSTQSWEITLENTAFTFIDNFNAFLLPTIFSFQAKCVDEESCAWQTHGQSARLRSKLSEFFTANVFMHHRQG